MNLVKALRAGKGSRIAFVGAGGKTTALFQTARQLEPPVVVTTSTHLGEWQVDLADVSLTVTRPEEIDRSAGQIEGVTLMAGPPTGNRRVGGLDNATLERLFQLSVDLDFPLLVEADGSRQKPLKAPGEHEPVIPEWIDHVVVCQGMTGLGKALNEGVVFRAERFGQLSGLKIGEAVTIEGLATLLAHPQGGKKQIPTGARVTALLNQVDDEIQLLEVMRIAKLLTSEYNSIIFSKLAEKRIWTAIEPTAGILLAAGGSARLGIPKILLDWHGKPLLRHAVETALHGGLDPLVVVLGAVVEPAVEILNGLPIKIVINPQWQEGQSTSIQAGLKALPEGIGGAVFLLADQPAVSPDLIGQLIKRHQSTLAPVVVPRVHGQRSNPVLFDRDTFNELLEIQGDTGGRAIIQNHELEYVDWDDPLLLLDIDTPEDYDRLLAENQI